jgi:hypothetical protein
MREMDLTVTDGMSAGAWIAPHLKGEFGAVTRHVPSGYDAYARIFHPARSSEGKRIRWREVASILGTTAHPEMQWHALSGHRPNDLRTAKNGQWTVNDPAIGEMDLDELDVLCGIIENHSSDTSRCYFGLSVIENWLSHFPPSDLKPLLKLPYGRDYVVLTGSLSAVDQIRRGFGRAAPNMVWPLDRSWLVISEVDFDSTLMGGPVEMIQAVCESPDRINVAQS